MSKFCGDSENSLTLRITLQPSGQNSTAGWLCQGHPEAIYWLHITGQNSDY